MENRNGNSNGAQISKASRSLDFKRSYNSTLSKGSPKCKLELVGRSIFESDQGSKLSSKSSKKVKLFHHIPKVKVEDSSSQADQSLKVKDGNTDQKVKDGNTDQKVKDGNTHQSQKVKDGNTHQSHGNTHQSQKVKDRNSHQSQKVKDRNSHQSQKVKDGNTHQSPKVKDGNTHQSPKVKDGNTDQSLKVKDGNTDQSLKVKEGNTDQSLKVKDGNTVVPALCNGESFMKRSWSSRKRIPFEAKSKTLTKDAEPSGDDENLEENGARMLSSRFDPSCMRFSSSNEVSASPSVTEVSYMITSGQNFVSHMSRSFSQSESIDAVGRVLRPRKHRKEKSNFGKRRHFYEFFSANLDAYWVLNKRVKVFWPLDNCWYHGIINEYDKERNLHHVKYDDRDEEWISLNNERFKLLLLPSEAPLRAETQDNRSHREKVSFEANKDEGKTDLMMEHDSFIGSFIDSEPIISWLDRSTCGLESSSFRFVKKQKTSGLSPTPVPSQLSNEANNSDGCVVGVSLTRNRLNRSAIKNSTFAMDSRFPLVYSRQRFCRTGKTLIHTRQGSYTGSSASKCFKHTAHVDVECWDSRNLLQSLDPDVALWWVTNNSGTLTRSIPRVPSRRFRFYLSFHLISVLNYSCEAEGLWLLRSVLLLQYGKVMNLWPRVSLKLLLVDNLVGSRFLFFEGCLMQAVGLVFEVLTLFHQFNKKGKYFNLQQPVTTISFKLSCVQDHRKEVVFAFYNFFEVKNSKWIYLDRKLREHCLLTRKLPLSECTYDNSNVLQKGSNQLCCSSICRGPFSPEDMAFHGCLSCTQSQLKTQNLSRWRVRDLINSSPNHHIDDQNIPGASGITPSNEKSGTVPNLLLRKELCCQSEKLSLSPTPLFDQDKIGAESNSYHYPNDVRIKIPKLKNNGYMESCSTKQISDLTWNTNGGIFPSPNPIALRSTWQPSRSRSSKSGDLSHRWSDGKCYLLPNKFGNGPKMPRTQLSYRPSVGFDGGSRNKSQQEKGFPHSRIRRTNDKRSANDFRDSQKNFELLSCDANVLMRSTNDFRDSQKNLELLSCDANVLITLGDRGWRECGAQVALEISDHNEWKLVVKISGVTSYTYKAHQIMQPGSSNRYTHAMMWKGGKDWIVEIHDRSQWAIFKEMYEECYIQNIRAALVKNIPIPGVRLIEEYDAFEAEVAFVRSSSNFKQIKNDVEMALDPSCFLYDMDSDDEKWFPRLQECFEVDKSISLEITEEMFEKTMDIFEKAAYVRQCDQFSANEVTELMAGVGPMQVIQNIFEYWQLKREMKRMALIRHLQPPLWERYQQQVREWELVMTSNNTTLLTESQEVELVKKPAMFAFCLKPRESKMPNKGSNHKSQKKFSISRHFNNGHRDHDRLRRRSKRFTSMDGKIEYLTDNYEPLEESSLPHTTSLELFSPCDSGNVRYLPSGGDKNNQQKPKRSKPKRYMPSFTSLNDMASYNQRLPKKRNKPNQWNMCYKGQVDGSNIEEFRLRDASVVVARHALKMAKLKRQKAYKMLCRADLAIHKSVVALMTADAIKCSSSNSNGGE